jgi:hypothetical protein
MSSSVSRLPSAQPTFNTRNVAPSLSGRAPAAPSSTPGASGVSLFVDPRKQPKSAPDLGTTPSAAQSSHTATYHGGPVLKNPVYVPIYYGQYWSTTAGKADAAHNDAFAKEFGKSEGNAILHQYGVGDGSFGGSTTVNVANPKKVTESQVQKIVKDQLAKGTVKPNAQGIYTVMLPPNTVLDAGGGVTSKNGLGGFHGSYNDANGKKVYYAVIAYSKGNNGIDFTGKAQDNLSITESHEWREASTDPDVNNGTLGWYNDQENGELDDLAMQFLPLNQVWGKDAAGFAVQKEWSNKDQKFELKPDVKGGGPVVDPRLSQPSGLAA